MRSFINVQKSVRRFAPAVPHSVDVVSKLNWLKSRRRIAPTTNHRTFQLPPVSAALLSLSFPTRYLRTLFLYMYTPFTHYAALTVYILIYPLATYILVWKKQLPQKAAHIAIIICILFNKQRNFTQKLHPHYTRQFFVFQYTGEQNKVHSDRYNFGLQSTDTET